MQTLDFVAKQKSGSTIVFTYTTSPWKLEPAAQEAFRVRAERVAALGEPWRTFFEPGDLARDLRTLGFTQTEDLGPPEIQARYFSCSSDGLRPGRTGHLMKAVI